MKLNARFWLLMGIIAVALWAADYGAKRKSQPSDEDRRKLWTALQARKVWIGMTAMQVRESWGDPQRINRTTRASGVSEQWIYERGYLYFDNGMLVTIQE